MERSDRGTSSQAEEASRVFADESKLEFREAHTLSVDPVALKLLDVVRARTLGAFPLAIEDGSPVFAVADPSPERLAAVQAVGGERTSFVVVAPATLEALMSSKIFNTGSPDGQAAAAPAEPAAPPAADPAPVEAEPEPTWEAGSTLAEQAPVSSPAERKPSRPFLVALGPDAPAELPSARLEDIVTQVAEGATSLATQADELIHAYSEAQRELANMRLQLAEARSENDAAQATIEALRLELATSQALNDAVGARLRELVAALEGSASGAARALVETDSIPMEERSRIA